MSHTVLHLQQNDYLRYSLERSLLKSLIKNPQAKVHYDINTSLWQVNKRIVRYNPAKNYSKLVGLILLFFQNLASCLNPHYRKKIRQAKQKLLQAQDEGFNAIYRKGRQVFSKANALPNLEQMTEKRKEEAEQIFSKTEKKIALAQQAHEQEQEIIHQEIEAEKKLLELLRAFQTAKIEDDKTAIDRASQALKDYPYFKDLDFSTIPEEHIDLMYTDQEKRVAEAQTKLEVNEDLHNALVLKLEDDKSRYEKTIETQETQLDAIYKSPLKSYLSPDTSATEHTPPKEIVVEKKSPKRKINRNLEAEFNVVNTAKVASAKVASTPRSLGKASQQFLSYIQKEVGEEAKNLWQVLLQHFLNVLQEDKLHSISPTGKPHQYLLLFKEPLRMWMHSTDEKGNEDPQGGIIFMLGSNLYKDRKNPKDTTMKVTFVKRKMKFEHGLEIFAKTPDWARLLTFGRIGKFDTSYVDEFYQTGDQYSTLVRWGIGKKERAKSTQEILDNWGTKGEVLQPKEDLQTKITSKLA